MPGFTPVNSLEIQLRVLLRNKHTPVWKFYTPLAAAELWVIAHNHPELDGSDLVSPPGTNPGICVFKIPQYSYVGIYTAECRAQEICTQWDISRTEKQIISAQGWELLRFLMTFDDVDCLWINGGLKDCQYQLNIDLVEILLSRPQPPRESGQPQRHTFGPTDEPAEFLGPLRDFLSRQPGVRAAWIFDAQPESPLPPGHRAYDVALLMQEPEDDSLLEEATTIAKAVTPVEMEWSAMALMADEMSLRNLAKEHPPFYASDSFGHPDK